MNPLTALPASTYGFYHSLRTEHVFDSQFAWLTVFSSWRTCAERFVFSFSSETSTHPALQNHQLLLGWSMFTRMQQTVCHERINYFQNSLCLPELDPIRSRVTGLSGRITPLTHNNSHCSSQAEGLTEEYSHWGFVLPHASHTSKLQRRPAAWTILCNLQMFVGES